METYSLCCAEKQSSFDSLCAFLYENDKYQYSLAEMEDRMNEVGKHQVGIQLEEQIRKKLLATFADNMTITDLPGENGVARFRDTAQKILHDKGYTDKAHS